MFQNMISLRIIRLVVKEISEKKFFAKNFLSLLGGGPISKKIKIKKIFQNMILCIYTILSQ